MARIIARIESQKGTCEAGHKVGDEFIIDPVRTPHKSALLFLEKPKLYTNHL